MATDGKLAVDQAERLSKHEAIKRDLRRQVQREIAVQPAQARRVISPSPDRAGIGPDRQRGV
jgi:hypothetical protein